MYIERERDREREIHTIITITTIIPIIIIIMITAMIIGGLGYKFGDVTGLSSEKGEVLLRGVGTLRYCSPPNASVQWLPDGLTIHTKE